MSVEDTTRELAQIEVVESYIRGLTWSAETSDEVRNAVVANLRGFWQHIREVPMRAWPPEVVPSLSDILGTICFEVIDLARLWREAGISIPTRAEDEQAYFIHLYLSKWFALGDDWRAGIAAEVDAKLKQVKAARAAAGSAA